MKSFHPTEEQRDATMVMKAGGMTDAQIASVLHIDQKTLVKHLSAELQSGKAEVDARVMSTLARLATSGSCPAATFFYLKTRCGWREDPLLAPDQRAGTFTLEELLITYRRTTLHEPRALNGGL